MHELLIRPVVADDRRDAARPNLTRIRYVYRRERSGGGQQVPVRECLPAVWRGDPDDALQAWYPDPSAAETESPDG